jgi:hypothetical protein
VSAAQRLGGVFVALVAAAVLGLIVSSPAAVSGTPRPIRPVLGDWEGSGPLGLRLSFAFVRRGGQVLVADLALGLPTGCRSRGSATWDAGTVARVEYVAPGTVLHGPFPPLGPRQFEFILPPTRQQVFVAPFQGTFSSSRRGVLWIESPTRFGCSHTAWPRTLRFVLVAARRVPVADGLWTGSVDSPAGATGTVRIRVIDHGRIETDFSAAYACPPPSGGGGSFEIGPLPSVGYPIAANGAIGATRGTEAAWRGRFAAGGVMRGKFIASFCSPSVVDAFTATRTGP